MIGWSGVAWAGAPVVVAPVLAWQPVTAPDAPRHPVAVSEAIHVSAPPSVDRTPVPVPTVLPVVVEQGVTAGRGLQGWASWYCRTGVSVCMAGHPPGEMAAAACGKLRRAMGPGWRGRTVTVQGPHNSVRVTLYDWCGSESKVIDLYFSAMSALGGTGVLPVVVSW